MAEQIRKNHFCVISKNTFDEYEMHDIQTNSGWNKNPYGEDYAVVPDDMVQDIIETKGFCDITLNDDGTEVVSFVAREIPELETLDVEEKVTLQLTKEQYNKLMTLLG